MDPHQHYHHHHHHHLDLDLDSGFEPQQRARSNTWPLPRPENYVDIKDEEPCDVDTLCGPGGGGGVGGLTAAMMGSQNSVGGSMSAHLSGLGAAGMDSLEGPCGIGGVGGSAAAAAAAAAKKNSSRRNAWGNMSYADLITQAIQSSPDNRLTLSQIYDWMVQNVAYFKDKGDSNSSAGWKNSIRHNLSLHNRFMRVQNEGTGKSSWWMINPDAKPGKSARRRATSMETSKYEKKRGRVKKKVEALRAGLTTTPSPSSSVSEGLDMFPESPQLLHSLAHSHGPHSHYQLQQLSPSDHFRPRASSNASSLGRLSPIPAVPESETQDGPWSPQDYSSRVASGVFSQQPGSAGDRFNPDQLVENIAESMKIRENGFPNSSSIATSGNGAGGVNSHHSSSSSSSSTTPSSSNGYSLCHPPPNYGGSSYNPVQHSQQQQQHQEFRSPPSSSSTVGRVTSNGMMPSQQQQLQRALSNGLPTDQAPPPYSIASLQVLSPAQSLRSLSPPPLQQADQTTHHHNNLANIAYSSGSGVVPVHGRFCTSSQSALSNNMISSSSNGVGSGLLRAALAQGNNSSSHSPSPPEHVRHSSLEMTPTPSHLMSHIMGVLNNNSSTLMPNDLDLHDLDSIQGGFEDCNVDEVIKHGIELNMDGSLDFNFSQQQQQQFQPQHHYYQQQHNHLQQQPVNSSSSDFSNLGHFAASANTTVQTQSGSLAPSAVSSQPPPLCSLAALAPGRSWEDF